MDAEDLIAKCVDMWKKVTSFESTITNWRFRACVDATCKTSNVIHLVECVRWQKQYVGERRTPYTYGWTFTDLITIGSSLTNPLWSTLHLGPDVWRFACNGKGATGFGPKQTKETQGEFLDPHASTSGPTGPKSWKLTSFEILKRSCDQWA